MNPYRYRGFTLIELLVVISVVAVLMSILLPVLGKAQDSARQVRSQSNLRQILLGYTIYQNDHDGHVLYGLTPNTVNGQPVTASAPSGHTFGPPVANRYPWRLAPYIDHVWPILYSHQAAPPLPQQGDSNAEAFTKAYNLSISPTYGINSIYVGGHGDGPFQGFASIDGVIRPNKGKHVVFRNIEVRQPSNLIVFADSKTRDGPSYNDPETGLYFLTPPRAKGHRWRAKGNEFELVTSGQITGLPEGRYGPATVTGFFDGHVATLRPEALEDMRLWANQADTADYDFVP